MIESRLLDIGQTIEQIPTRLVQEPLDRRQPTLHAYSGSISMTVTGRAIRAAGDSQSIRRNGVTKRLDLLTALLVAALPIIACSHHPAEPRPEPCWMIASIQWTHATLPAPRNGYASVRQTVTIHVSPGSSVINGSHVYWMGPETGELTFLQAGVDEDGVIVASYPIFDYLRNYGQWMAYVAVALACQEEAFIDSLAFEIEEEQEPLS